MANILFDIVETFFDRAKSGLDLNLGLPLLRRKFRKELGYELNTQNPQTLNEKIQWMKFNTSGNIYVRAADKLEMPNLVRELIGKELCKGLFTAVLHNTANPDDISFETLPQTYVIKPTHGSGWVKLITHDHPVDYDALRDECKSWLRRRYGRRQHEWPYLKIKPQIMIEEMLESDDRMGANDIKLHVIHGKVERIKIFSNRFGEKKECTVSDDWLPIFENEKLIFPKPFGWEKMQLVATEIGKHFPHVRVDFLSTSTRFSLNELTFFPQSGFLNIPYDYDLELGKKIDINKF